ncbi:hypothetical protein Ahy_A05g023061 [Arachis hypogaea]|uniref:Uncharacterized protein n=1 Tax=Arachis hypogaea TaxID=3818 RepID=A0A445D2E0_ARAHY|nr:hypothetical protein Ahy_A05g023061 [Arachis hypogaea]
MSQDHAQLDSSLIWKVVLRIIKTDPSVSIPMLQSTVHQSYHFKPSHQKVQIAKQKTIAQIYETWLTESGASLIRSFGHSLHALKCLSIVSLCIYRQDTLPGILIISDRSHVIHTTLNAPHSGWHPPSAYHAYCIRHMTLNFNLRFKSAEGKSYLINLVYSPRKEGCYWYLNALGTLSREMLDWTLRFRKDLLLQHCDEGSRYGHMMTNLLECIIAVLKGIRNLLVAAIVKATYERLQQLFVRKSHEAHAQLQGEEIYSQQLLAAIEKNRESLPMM